MHEDPIDESTPERAVQPRALRRPRSSILAGRLRSVRRRPGTTGGPAAGSILALAGALGFLASACRSPDLPRPAGAEIDQAAGYALLDGVVSKNRHVDKLLLIKFESDDTERIVDRMANRCAAISDWLAELAEGRGFDYEREAAMLPVRETEARATLEERTTDALLGASGPEFEFRLLSEQQKAIGYAYALCKALLVAEKNAPARSQLETWIARLEEDLEVLDAAILRHPRSEKERDAS